MADDWNGRDGEEAVYQLHFMTTDQIN